jgi:oligopeptide/dipeptide ABC transporter ATP-binding protein
MYKGKGAAFMELLKVQSLRRYFDVKDKYKGGHRVLKAVDSIDFSIDEDSIFALVGESGCGKTTVAKLVLRLVPPTSGEISFKGRDIWGLKKDSMQEFRKSVQIIFQDPFASLNPRRTVFDTISEPFKIHRVVDKGGMKDAVTGLLSKIGLGSDVLNRYPHEFSGGQRQRICIARALSLSPKLIVADEPLSALDVSIQAQILNLLKDIKRQSKVSFLFISHDLNVVHYFSDYIGVMYLGKIVEKAKTEELFNRPLHPYAEILLASAPKVRSKNDKLRPSSSELRTDIGDVPSPIDIPEGCPFHPRCPRRFDPCDKTVPILKEPETQEYKGRLVSCHLWNP